MQTFLKVLAERGDNLIQSGRLDEGQQLSGSMWESWQSGDFWVSYAARKGFAFDAVYWQKTDGRFFGMWLVERRRVLGEEERRDIECVVQRKMDDMGERALAWDPDEYTALYEDFVKITRSDGLL